MVKFKNERSKMNDVEMIDEYYRKESNKIWVVNSIERCLKEHGGEHINLRMCLSIRDMVSKGMSVEAISECIGYFDEEEIRPHANNECTHSDSEGLLYSECGWMRALYDMGRSVNEIAEYYEVDEAVVIHHITGECDHEDSLEPVDIEDIE